ncbi:siderophore ABC transporter substrate-binding protein [Alkalicoccus urumqiensis]|uniref:ABC transporter n=1 Tax=Alkalicoccus urumqiensis TaxID=1548213 RepID=A0A2P6MK16_ALKUR|nr:siderophore ABC transporter substrate-binding protein [Alkalicoccus urumqiensis]PRO66603.1 ABC transporter [Alkalicoccus urumqiensis]
MKKMTWTMMTAGAVLLTACVGAEEENSTAAEAESPAENTEAGSDGAENEEENSGTITVEHDLGTTDVPKEPETIVVFDYGVLDTLDTFGVEPAAVPQGNIPAYLSEYEGEAYENAGTLFEPDFEAIYDMEPDLILIGGRTGEAYEELSEIAPTVLMSVDAADYIASFEEQTTLLGDIFGEEEAAEEAVASVQDGLDELTEEAPEGEGLMVMANEGSISAYGPGSRFGILHNEMEIAAADDTIEDSNHGQNVSFEYVLETNPDYLFVLDRGAVVSEGEGETAAELLDNELIHQTNAHQEDHIVYLTPDYWYLAAGGVTSVQEMIKEVKEGIAE